MSESVVSVSLSEWETRAPTPDSVLCGVSFGEDKRARQLAEQLTAAKRLEIQELRSGLYVGAKSFVGRVRLGGVEITVRPKIGGQALLRMLRYAYGLRDLQLYDPMSYQSEQGAFQDLLIRQLAAEVAELLSRGLHRRYIEVCEDLQAPRGRFDLQRIAQQGGVAEATLPCRHHPRLENCLVNQVVLAGLHLAARLTGDRLLKARLRRLAALLEGEVARISLDGHVLQQLHRQSDRLTAAYHPAIEVIGLLLESEGVSLEDGGSSLRMPGFLFDMNRFFQALLSRFLHENLPDCVVQDEHRLRGMLVYEPGYNPQNRRAHDPRPDYVVTRQGQTCAVLDAKYIDLWERPIGREALYQLAMYALGHSEVGVASILYPAVETAAQEARISVRDPLLGGSLAKVILRPVRLHYLADLLSEPLSAVSRRRRGAYAQYLAFGDTNLPALDDSFSRGLSNVSVDLLFLAPQLESVQAW